MREYYSSKLSGEKLRRCYELASPRVAQYLRAEIRYVLDNLGRRDTVLELGCGYGRVLLQVGTHVWRAIGVDTSRESLVMARSVLQSQPTCHLFQMNAAKLALSGDSIDTVVCIQNGISAFNVDPLNLVKEGLRVTRPGGKCLFSSYSDGFWDERLDWFRLQSKEGLIGRINFERTRDGTIVCDDGFTATAFGVGRFRALMEEMRLDARIEEVDGSSVFCVIDK